MGIFNLMNADWFQRQMLMGQPQTGDFNPQAANRDTMEDRYNEPLIQNPNDPGQKVMDGNQWKGWQHNDDFQALENEKNTEVIEQKISAKKRVPGVEDAIVAAAQANGLDPDGFKAIGKLESSLRPDVVTGSYKGLFQLSEQQFKKYGGEGSIFDPVQNATAAARKIRDESQKFEKTYGRAPTIDEIYYIHQQGPAGARSHWKNPDKPAWETVREFYPSEKVAKDAIWLNTPMDQRKKFGSVENITSKDHFNMWKQKISSAGGLKPEQVSSPIFSQGESPNLDELPKTAPTRFADGLSPGTGAVSPNEALDAGFAAEAPVAMTGSEGGTAARAAPPNTVAGSTNLAGGGQTQAGGVMDGYKLGRPLLGHIFGGDAEGRATLARVGSALKSFGGKIGSIGGGSVGKGGSGIDMGGDVGKALQATLPPPPRRTPPGMKPLSAQRKSKKFR